MARIAAFATASLAALALSFTGTAFGAAPRLILLSGKPLQEQVVLDRWDVNAKFLETLDREPMPVDPALLEARPYLNVLVFWGSSALDDFREGRSLDPLLASGVGQRGRFYPAAGGNDPAIYLPWSGAWPRAVPPEGLEILAQHGVPVRIGEDRSFWSRPTWWAAVLGSLFLIGALVGVAIRYRTRSSDGGLAPAPHDS